jgi:RsmE family RNA methyltransferase
VNIVLFADGEVDRSLPRDDPRSQHILSVLRRAPGESLDVGRINGPRGKAKVESVTDLALTLSFTWDSESPVAEHITLICGLCRPQTSRRVLREAATLGVDRMFFARTDRGEASYAGSSLWSTGEHERQVRSGVEQAFATRLPNVEFGMSLTEAIADAAGDVRIGLDNYEGIQPLHTASMTADVSLVLAVGSERGWSQQERDLLRESQYVLVGLGSRVLRTETAIIAALSVIKSRTGAWDDGPTVDTRQTDTPQT